MEVLNRPELTHLQVGENLKILQIKALSGTGMPKHHSTTEAVIVVLEGKAILKAKETEYLLEKGSSMLVPAGLEHSLTILEEFQAVAIMAKDANINFNN
ncbi:cupin domain-containing protein [Arenibacter sp. F26102]|uniref:cupin domain-containing protein n=1 Tax=Arenibacter sp. F26102 TaxID=2926416 RepID=UPI001FF12E01|nr:cupin domain-containing protein [Arenibacter sp. F26102]MCK0144771.1 cupin domain-containing protein [Arenibacter sp. F26102]